MLCENVRMMIQNYVDDELEKGKEPFIFTHLAQCDDCRNHFKVMNSLTTAAKNDAKEFPSLLERRILTSIAVKNENKYVHFISGTVQKVIPYVLTLILFFISLFLFRQTNAYEEKLNEAVEEIKTQKIKVELLYNSLPQTVVEEQLENKVIIHANM